MPRGITPNPYSLEMIAERLKLLRRTLDLSQQMMGTMAGVTGNAWHNYEVGRRWIEIEQAIRLKITTGCPIEWIYTGDERGVPRDLAKRLATARKLQQVTSIVQNSLGR